mmetsp:Transcript_128939/g.223666  ORF Transcript_128939/g.223666 Transcript_128939/m.223666 type:complete len:659 (+) Transcript_128939:50-2026(+)
MNFFESFFFLLLLDVRLTKSISDDAASTIMQGFDTNKDGKISMDELAEHAGDHPNFKGWQAAFKNVDTDRDGYLTSAEVGALLAQSSKQEQEQIVDDSEESIAASVMDGLDTNKDGKLTLQELEEHVGDNKGLHSTFEGWRTGFEDADADKDGHLTVHELAGLLKNTVSPQDQHTLAQESMESIAGSIMDGLDADKDGKLSLMELVDHIGQDKQAQANWQGWEAGFKEADADKDGHLMLQELVVFVSHMSRQKQHDLVEESEKSIGDSILTGFDTNRDGKISLQELMDHVGDDKEVHAAFKGWQDGFKEADIDNDGFLSAEELTSLISHVSREDQHHMVEESEKSIGDSMLDAWDANKDGKISLKELMNRAGDKKEITAAFESGFRDSDANQDGLLDAKELTTLISHVSTKQQKKLADDSWSKTVSKLLEGYDLNKDGKVSLEEMKKHMERATAFQGAYEGWEIGFQEADADQDGHLSADELQYFFAHLSKSFQRSLISDEVKSFVKKFFLACDVDKNGRVTSKELMDQVSGKSEIQAFQEGWQNAFVETDTDKDGQLSVEEMASIFPRVTEQHRRKMFEESEVAAASVLAAFDTDKDGKLSVSELAGKVAGPTVQGFTGWQAGFKDADADRDGYLSAEEIAAWFKAISKPTAKHDEM